MMVLNYHKMTKYLGKKKKNSYGKFIKGFGLDVFFLLSSLGNGNYWSGPHGCYNCEGAYYIWQFVTILMGGRENKFDFIEDT